MSHVINFKIVNIALAGNAVSFSLADDLLGGKIAVRLLRAAKQRNVILQLIQKLLISGLDRRVDRRLHPFIEIAVTEYSSVKFSLSLSCRNPEVLNNMTDILALKHSLQMRNRCVRAGIKALLIQAARPFNIIVRD